MRMMFYALLFCFSKWSWLFVVWPELSVLWEEYLSGIFLNILYFSIIFNFILVTLLEYECFNLGGYHKGAQLYMGCTEPNSNFSYLCNKALNFKSHWWFKQKLFLKSIYETIRDIQALGGYVMILSVISNL